MCLYNKFINVLEGLVIVTPGIKVKLDIPRQVIQQFKQQVKLQTHSQTKQHLVLAILPMLDNDLVGGLVVINEVQPAEGGLQYVRNYI